MSIQQIRNKAIRIAETAINSALREHAVSQERDTLNILFANGYTLDCQLANACQTQQFARFCKRESITATQCGAYWHLAYRGTQGRAQGTLTRLSSWVASWGALPLSHLAAYQASKAGYSRDERGHATLIAPMDCPIIPQGHKAYIRPAHFPGHVEYATAFATGIFW